MARKNKLRTKRVYYGPPGKEKAIYWTVTVSDATQNVTINGNIMHALRSFAGMTIGCSLSNTTIGNTDVFPHKVYLAVITPSRAWIVDALKKNGEPGHSVLYAHSYRHITDMNDTRTLKQFVKEDPSIMERPFVLRIPPKKKKKAASGKGIGVVLNKAKTKTKGKSTDRTAVFQGALARAVKAGLVDQAVATQFEEVAERGEQLVLLG